MSLKKRDGEALNEKIYIATFPLSAVGGMFTLQIFSDIMKQFDDLSNTLIVVDDRIDYRLCSSDFHRFSTIF